MRVLSIDKSCKKTLLHTADFDKWKTNTSVAADKQTAFTEATGKMQQQYESEYASIMNSRELNSESKDIAANNLREIYKENFQFMAKLYDYKVEWSDFFNDTSNTSITPQDDDTYEPPFSKDHSNDDKN